MKMGKGGYSLMAVVMNSGRESLQSVT